MTFLFYEPEDYNSGMPISDTKKVYHNVQISGGDAFENNPIYTVTWGIKYLKMNSNMIRFE